MPSGARDVASGDLRVDWKQHLGLIFGAATALFVCLKLFGVAAWDHRTAFAILSENGTANVVTGSILTLLPMVVVPLGIGLLPKLTNRLEVADNPERRALVVFALLLTVFIGFNAAAILFVVGLVAALVWLGQYVYWTVKMRRAKRELQEAKDAARSASLELLSLLFRHLYLLRLIDESRGESGLRERDGQSRKREQKNEVRTTENGARVIARKPKEIDEGEPEKPRFSFTMNAAFALAAVLSTMGLPWLPPEIIEHEGESRTVFVLNQQEEDAVVLFDSNRSVQHIDADLVEGRYCKPAYSWLSDPLPASLIERGYPECPRGNSSDSPDS